METRPVQYVTRALVTFALVLFVITELAVVAALWSVPNGQLNLGFAAKFLLPFLASLPMLAGARGYFTVKRRMLSSDYNTGDELSRQFLTTIIIAYAVMIFMVSALQR